MTNQKNADALFTLNGVPPLGQVVPLGLQHVVAAIVGVVTPAILVSGTCGIEGPDRTIMIQMSLVISALATLLQLFPIFRTIGAGLPVIMGVSFAYIPTLQSIGTGFQDMAQAGGYNVIRVILGAQIIGGLTAIIFGIFLKRLRKLFPPIVTGTVIFTIGLSLYPTAVRYMAGGSGNPDFGSPKQWLVAIITLGVVVFMNYFTKGSLKLASILVGMVVGYFVVLVMGMVSFDAVFSASWAQIIPPLHFGMPVFIPSACISMAIMYIVNSVQAIGDFSSTTLGGLDREPTDQELSGGIMANGLASIVGAFFGGLPTATYSQNVGIVTVNRVVNKTVFAFAAGVLLVAGFIPKFSSVLTTIPQCVIGGATISVFATITMTGIRMITSATLTPRNVTVVGLAVALGVGVTQVQNCLGGFPAWVGVIFGGSSVVIATLGAILLNTILPKDSNT